MDVFDWWCWELTRWRQLERAILQCHVLFFFNCGFPSILEKISRFKSKFYHSMPVLPYHLSILFLHNFCSLYPLFSIYLDILIWYFLEKIYRGRIQIYLEVIIKTAVFFIIFLYFFYDFFLYPFSLSSMLRYLSYRKCIYLKRMNL